MERRNTHVCKSLSPTPRLDLQEFPDIIAIPHNLYDQPSWGIPSPHPRDHGHRLAAGRPSVLINVYQQMAGYMASLPSDKAEKGPAGCLRVGHTHQRGPLQVPVPSVLSARMTPVARRLPSGPEVKTLLVTWVNAPTMAGRQPSRGTLQHLRNPQYPPQSPCPPPD